MQANRVDREVGKPIANMAPELVPKMEEVEEAVQPDHQDLPAPQLSPSTPARTPPTTGQQTPARVMLTPVWERKKRQQLSSSVLDSRKRILTKPSNVRNLQSQRTTGTPAQRPRTPPTQDEASLGVECGQDEASRVGEDFFASYGDKERNLEQFLGMKDEVTVTYISQSDILKIYEQISQPTRKPVQNWDFQDNLLLSQCCIVVGVIWPTQQTN